MNIGFTRGDVVTTIAPNWTFSDGRPLITEVFGVSSDGLRIQVVGGVWQEACKYRHATRAEVPSHLAISPCMDEPGFGT